MKFVRSLSLAAFLLSCVLGRAASDTPVAGSPTAKLQDLDRIPFPRHVVPPVCPPNLGQVRDLVKVDFVIDEMGAVTQPEAKSGQSPALREAAVAAISRWHFDAPTRNGQATRVAASQVFSFAPAPGSAGQTGVVISAPGDATSAAAEPPADAANSLIFSLLPRSLQKDPAVRMTAITDVTPEGTLLAPPTAAHPRYFLLQPGASQGKGSRDSSSTSTDSVQSQLQAALAERHYLPADGLHPATLLITFSWGSTERLDHPAFADPGARDAFLARTDLVGGERFANQVATALTQNDIMINAGLFTVGLRPLEILQDSETTIRQLIEEASIDRNFVVVSAFDASAVAHGQRRQLWQTKLTINAQDVSMAESLPVLFHKGAPYLGRAMNQAVVFRVQPLRDGQAAPLAN